VLAEPVVVVAALLCVLLIVLDWTAVAGRTMIVPLIVVG
jgi:hypothetical protein